MGNLIMTKSACSLGQVKINFFYRLTPWKEISEKNPINNTITFVKYSYFVSRELSKTLIRITPLLYVIYIWRLNSHCLRQLKEFLRLRSLSKWVYKREKNMTLLFSLKLASEVEKNRSIRNSLSPHRRLSVCLLHTKKFYKTHHWTDLILPLWTHRTTLGSI